jgi:2-oxoglutarate dehydrogenase E2 component (dihydrolipoamide succinyltransferase)
VIPSLKESLKNLSNVSSYKIFLLTFLKLIDPGDFVNADEIIARIETDKVTVDITSPSAGVIEKYFAAEGDTVDVGSDFYSLDTDAKGGSAPAPKAAAPTPA